MTEHVIVTDADGIRTIRMNRPDKKNALTLAMYEAMTAALEGANALDSVRCVLIAGVPGAFSAGNGGLSQGRAKHRRPQSLGAALPARARSLQQADGRSRARRRGRRRHHHAVPLRFCGRGLGRILFNAVRQAGPDA